MEPKRIVLMKWVCGNLPDLAMLNSRGCGWSTILGYADFSGLRSITLAKVNQVSRIQMEFLFQYMVYQRQQKKSGWKPHSLFVVQCIFSWIFFPSDI